MSEADERAHRHAMANSMVNEFKAASLATPGGLMSEQWMKDTAHAVALKCDLSPAKIYDTIARHYAAEDARVQELRAASPDDIRALGWTVACHNDYRQLGEIFTFWLFTRGSSCVKGEGKTDADALSSVRKALGAWEPVSASSAGGAK
jgi:hypothetical protein